MDSKTASKPPLPAPAVSEVARRLVRLPLLKAVGIPAFIALFFVGYFTALNHPLFPVHLMPEWGIDRWIGYHDGWTWVYFTLWVYVVLPPSFMDDLKPILTYAATAAALSGVALAFFFLWPTQVPLIGGGFLKAVDRGGNACPSLHVAFALWAAWRIELMLRGKSPRRRVGLRLANALWCGAIIYSTMATKQHVAIDVVCGVGLGGLTAVSEHLWSRSFTHSRMT